MAKFSLIGSRSAQLSMPTFLNTRLMMQRSPDESSCQSSTSRPPVERQSKNDHNLDEVLIHSAHEHPASRTVIVTLPTADQAPGWRNALEESFDFQVEDLDNGRARIRPRGGAGQIADHFVAHRLCDRKTSISSSTWEPLTRFPRADIVSAHFDTAMAEVKRRAALETIEASLSALALAVSVLPIAQTAQFLEAQLPDLFTSFPDASIYLVHTSPVLQARLAFLRLSFAMHTAPDLDVGDLREDQVRPLTYQSLTKGADFGEALKPLFLIFSPAATGYPMTWLPHSLVIDFGDRMLLQGNTPDSRSALYDPSLFGIQVDRLGIEFGNNLNAGHLNSLLGWWIKRLNVLYSLSSDPTRFSLRTGDYDVARQMGWHLTMERLLADLIIVNANPQAPALTRLGAAFDLLDKAETLLGYSSQGSGKGFERLLNRSVMMPLLDRSWQRLPVQLRARFTQHTRKLFDQVYEAIREHTLHQRRTAKAIKLLAPSGKLHARPLDQYVPQLARAIRNSSHGLLQQLSTRDLDLVATHDAALPPALADLAALIALALVADIERVVEGKWWSG
jgi:hypothetical protein